MRSGATREACREGAGQKSALPVDVGLDGVHVVHAFHLKAEQVLEAAVESGKVRELQKVFRGDLWPQDGDFRLDIGAHFAVVQTDAVCAVQDHFFSGGLQLEIEAAHLG